MPAAASPRPDAKGASAQPTVENIQALRGIAALLVVWAHLKFPLMLLCPQVEDFVLIHTAHGAIGVDIFFTISGFVICLTAAKRHGRPLDFFCARIARVSPLYLVAIVLPFIGFRYAAWPHLSFKSVWNQVLYLPVFDFRDYTVPPVEVGWSLSFEMWFYVVFALLLNLGPARKVAWFLPLFFGLGAALMVFYTGAWYFPRFAFHPFVLEFAFGCLIFQTQQWVSSRLSWVFLFGGALAMLAFSRETGYLGWHGVLLSARLDWAWQRVLVWGVPSAFVVAGLVGLERTRGLVLPTSLIWLGEISYSLYLTHPYAMNLTARLGQRVGLHNPVVSIIAVFVISIFAARICWMRVEKPLTTCAQGWVRKWIRSAPPQAKEPDPAEPASTVL